MDYDSGVNVGFADWSDSFVDYFMILMLVVMMMMLLLILLLVLLLVLVLMLLVRVVMLLGIFNGSAFTSAAFPTTFVSHLNIGEMRNAEAPGSTAG